MTRKLSSWNLFVKKIYNEGKAKNKDYQFKEALKYASQHKSEMKNMSVSNVKNSNMTKKKGGRRRRSTRRRM